MFLGHYGLAFGAKRLAPVTSLGTLILAAQLADEVWPIMLLARVEKVRVVPGLQAASPMDFVSYPITHSLLTGAVAGLIFGVLYFLARRQKRGAWVVGALVPSHWFLDLLMHRPDLPLWPGGSKVGLGAWDSVPLTLLLELVFFGGGLVVYLRSTVAIDRTGTVALWAMVGLLGLFYSSGFIGPPPSPEAVAWGALLLWLFVPWGYWIDRHRRLATNLS